PERMKGGIDRLARTAEKSGRDPGSIGIGYLWFKPVSWTEARTKDGARQMFTGSSAQMVEDAAALRDVGVRHVVVLLATPSETETMERMQRFADEVVRAV